MPLRHTDPISAWFCTGNLLVMYGLIARQLDASPNRFVSSRFQPRIAYKMRATSLPNLKAYAMAAITEHLTLYILFQLNMVTHDERTRVM